MKKLSTLNENAVTTPIDGEYMGRLCGCTFHIEGMDEDFELEYGAMGAFEGKFRIESGNIYMIEGFQCLGKEKFKCVPSENNVIGKFREI